MSAGGGGEAATPDELIGGAPLLVFAAEACPYCLELRRELASAGLEPEVHMLDASGREALRQRTGQRTVPYVFVGERFVGGCDDGPEPWMGAMPLLRSGALQQLLDRPREWLGCGRAGNMSCISSPLLLPCFRCYLRSGSDVR